MTPEALQRYKGGMSREPLQRMPCGCTYRGEQWVQMCEPHQKESDEISERWAADRQRQRELEELLR